MALNAIMNEPERLFKRAKMKKTNQGVRCGEREEHKEDPEQYDDTGLYLGFYFSETYNFCICEFDFGSFY